jgi:hypothetical protein
VGSLIGLWCLALASPSVDAVSQSPRFDAQAASPGAPELPLPVERIADLLEQLFLKELTKVVRSPRRVSSTVGMPDSAWCSGNHRSINHLVGIT